MKTRRSCTNIEKCVHSEKRKRVLGGRTNSVEFSRL